MPRCQCDTKNKYICKLKSHFCISEKRYCFTHAKKKFDNIVILIQKHYRGFRIRNKINTLFIPLPLEIQKIILGYVKESYYLKKYNKSIQKILSNRVKKIQIINDLPVFVEKDYNIYYNQLEYYKKFISIYNLYIKYNLITEKEDDYYLYKRVNTIWNLFSKQIEQYILFNLSYENLIDNCNWRKIHYKLYSALTRFQNIYNYNYPKYINFNTYRQYLYYD